MVEGITEIAGTMLGARDGLGVSNSREVDIKAKSDCELLVFDIPMAGK